MSGNQSKPYGCPGGFCNLANNLNNILLHDTDVILLSHTKLSRMRAASEAVSHTERSPVS